MEWNLPRLLRLWRSANASATVLERGTRTIGNGSAGIVRAAISIQAAPQLSPANLQLVIQLLVGMGIFPMRQAEGRGVEAVGRSPIVRTATHPIIGRCRRGWGFDTESEKKNYKLSMFAFVFCSIFVVVACVLTSIWIETSSSLCDQFIPEEQAVLLSYLVSYPIRYAVFITLIPTVAITRLQCCTNNFFVAQYAHTSFIRFSTSLFYELLSTMRNGPIL